MRKLRTSNEVSFYYDLKGDDLLWQKMEDIVVVAASTT